MDRSSSPSFLAPGTWLCRPPAMITSFGKSAIVSFPWAQQGGLRLYSHSFIACDPKPGGTGLEVRVALRRGVTVSGRVVGPDDQPVPDTWIIGRAALGPTSIGMALLVG